LPMSAARSGARRRTSCPTSPSTTISR
jgi:hypothetical protein